MCAFTHLKSYFESKVPSNDNRTGEGAMDEGKMSVGAQTEYLRMMQRRYRDADRVTKSRLLDELEEVTLLSRKHLIALMNRSHVGRRKRSRERQRVYGPEVAEALRTIAEALDWLCPERLQPVLGSMAQRLMACGEMQVSEEVLEKLERISVATVGRLLKGVCSARKFPRPYPGRRADTSAQQAVPIRIIPWQQSVPGHFEVDLVHHGTADRRGNLVCTIQFVDVLTGWSERFAIMGYTFETIWQAIQDFRGHCPLPVRELHSDNGSEFINHALNAAFGQELVGIAQTRGRPGYHNDNRFVEQKNSSLVRAYLGNLPLHTSAELLALNTLYQDMWLYYNFFQPVLRQTERTAVTGPDGLVRIRRKQDRAQTPFQRLCEAQPPLSREKRERLHRLYETTNPMALKRRIHAQIEDLIAMVAVNQETLAPV
jgi:hypothetical protein